MERANQNILSDDFNFKSKMLVIACAASLVATGLIYVIILIYDRHGKRPMGKAQCDWLSLGFFQLICFGFYFQTALQDFLSKTDSLEALINWKETEGCFKSDQLMHMPEA